MHLLNVVLVVVFLVDFSNQKHFFLLSFFLCLLYNLKSYSFQCVVSNFNSVNHMLNVLVRRGMGIYCLFFYVLDIFLVRLDVLSLE